MTVINQAVMLMDNENAFYCPVHFFYAAKVLDKIMKVRSDGTVSSVGLSILQVLANKVLVDFVEKRSLYWSLRRFMALYSESSELEFNKTGKLTRGSYQPFTLGDVSIHYCIECLSPKPFGEIHFLRDRLHKVAFAIYAGPCLQKMLSVEQAHAVVALPEIPVCSCHLFKMACVLDTLVPRLHRVQERKEFTECMMNCFGKGWMSSLKAVYAFRDKYIEEKPNTHTCKFCGQTDGNVKDDRQLNISAHHACFKNRVCDVLWQLRYVKKSTNAAVEVHVPMPGEFEFWTNGMLDRLLIEINRYFPQQGQLSKTEQRVNCIVMFARLHLSFVEQTTCAASQNFCAFLFFFLQFFCSNKFFS
nr:protein T05A8.7 [imported] - Caenorhabditis elegans [Caenorhabditis elegans]